MAIYRDIKLNNGTVNDRFGAVGTVTGATFSQKEKGLALVVGSNKYVTYNQQLLPSGAFSVIVWAKAYFPLISTGNIEILGASTSALSETILLNLTSLENPVLFLGANNYRAFNYTLDRNWHCFVFTIPGSAQTDMSSSQMFVDTISKPITVTNVTGAQSARSGYIYAGGGNTTTAGANISRIKVYDTVLTQQEINAEYAEFLASQPINKPKRGFILNKPNDLSSQVNNTLGAELITNIADREFTSDTGFWIKGAGWTISGDAANATASWNSLSKTGITVENTYYLVTYTIKNYVSGNLRCVLGATGFGTTRSGNGTYTEIVKAVGVGGTSFNFVSATVQFVGSIDDVSLRPMSGLIAAYNMVKNGNTLVDISGNGNNLTLAAGNTYSTKDGVGFPNSGYYTKTGFVGLNTGLNANAYTMSVRFKLKELGREQQLVNLISLQPPQRYINPANKLNMAGTSGVLTGNTTLIKNVWYTASFLVKNIGAEIYLNGVSDGSNTTYTENITALTLWLGQFNGLGNYILNGEIADLRIHNRVLTPQECRDYHNSFVLPTLVEDFSDAGADGITKTDAPAREWERVSGTWKVGQNVVSNTQMIVGGPNFSTNVGWNLSGSTISGGIYTGTTGGLNYCTSNLTLTAGKRYRVEVNILTDTAGTSKVYVGGKNSSVLPVGRTVYYVVMDSVSNQLVGFNDLIGTSNYLSITEAPQLETMTNGTKYLECVTAGMVSIPSTTAYGSWEFGIMMGSSGESGVLFVQGSAPYTSFFDPTGYAFAIRTSNAVQMFSNTTISLISSITTARSTWYDVKITRTVAGVFIILMKGGALTPTAGYDGWTYGGTFTNTTYTTSGSLVLDLDAGTRFSLLDIKDGIKG